MAHSAGISRIGLIQEVLDVVDEISKRKDSLSGGVASKELEAEVEAAHNKYGIGLMIELNAWKQNYEMRFLDGQKLKKKRNGRWL